MFTWVENVVLQLAVVQKMCAVVEMALVEMALVDPG
jgi:hypothetical protein